MGGGGGEMTHGRLLSYSHPFSLGAGFFGCAHIFLAGEAPPPSTNDSRVVID